MPAQQHPVPQNISSYEFRLVGDMTLRQFGYLAGGVAVALFFYALPLPAYLKWPLALSSGFLGFALAFMPIEERPLATWMAAFIRAVFSPTIFVWQKQKQIPEIFVPITLTAKSTKSPLRPADKTQLNEYLRTLPATRPANKLDQMESTFLQQIAALFPKGQMKMPTLVIPTPTINPNQTPKPVFKFEPTEPKKETKEVKVPSERIISIPVLTKPVKPVILPEKPGRTVQPTVKPKLSDNLPIPTPPNRPNIVVGMVIDQNSEIVDGAIIEIRNHLGMPVRALKTNKLGQFMIATPLENDIYEIETEKEGFLFDIIKLEVKGEIIQPLEIRAKPAL